MAFALISLIALPTIPAVALLVRPILINLTTTGSGANGSLEVVNDRNRPMAVEVKVNKLEVPERGAVIVTPDEGSDFQIFPPIASIPAGGRQIFRIRWIGEPNLAASRLFMFSTAELPVAETTGQTSVQVLYAIQSVVAVRPPQARSAIEVAEVRRAKSPKGEDGLEIIFANEGAAMDL
jgi:fimbrial chaperone protein